MPQNSRTWPKANVPDFARMQISCAQIFTGFARRLVSLGVFDQVCRLLICQELVKSRPYRE